MIEPLVTDKRDNLFPIIHDDIWELYQKEKASFWVPEELDFVSDIKDWNALTDNEKFFIGNTLGFFQISDGIISENLVSNFSAEFEAPEIKFFYNFKSMMEDIHQHTYNLLIDTYIKDSNQKGRLLNSNKIEYIKAKTDWCLKRFDKSNTIHERLLAENIFEAIFFSGSFASIFWLKKRGLMPGLCEANAIIARDEALHVQAGTLILNKMVNKINALKVYELVEEAMEIEIEFITKSIPVSLIGMNSKLMIQYIKFVSDRLLIDLNYKPLYNVTNPFDWMDMISLDSKSNFFERKVVEYNKAGVGENMDKKEIVFDEDF